MRKAIIIITVITLILSIFSTAFIVLFESSVSTPSPVSTPIPAVSGE